MNQRIWRIYQWVGLIAYSKSNKKTVANERLYQTTLAVNYGNKAASLVLTSSLMASIGVTSA